MNQVSDINYSNARMADIRALAAAVVIEQIKAALRSAEATPLLGVPYLTIWFQNGGWWWLQTAGMGDIACIEPEVLARMVFETGPGALMGTRCHNCTRCLPVNDNGRVGCLMNKWGGRNYAASTVKSAQNPMHRDGCGEFNRR